MVDVPLPEQIACLEREVRMRRRVYPRWVGAGRMTQAAAEREIAGMEAALATLKSLPGSATQQSMEI